MIEANTSYLWQTSSCVNAKVLCASVPASLSRTQSEFDLAWTDKMRSSKHNHADIGVTAPLSAFFVYGKNISAADFSID